MEIILTAQTFTCRYQVAFTKQNTSQHQTVKQNHTPRCFGGPWQLVIKIEGDAKGVALPIVKN